MILTFQMEDGRRVPVACQPGENVRTLAVQAGIGLDAPCAGNGSCGKCRVRLLSGSLVSSPSSHITPEEYDQGWRLGCHSTVSGDAVVLVPASASVWRNGMRFTEAQSDAILALKTGLEAAGVFMGNDFQVTAPEDTRCVGCAIDVGTTTVSAMLLDLRDGGVLAQASCGNAQIPFGGDVISRIMAQSRPGGRERLRAAILDETITPLLERLCARVGISPDNILRVSIAANTTMNHLLLGLDAEPIRLEPYVPGFLWMDELTAGEVGLPVNPEAAVRITPNVGSYVGGDITAGVLASGLWRGQALRLLVDLGTNGELVLGNEEFLLCCACSAGPAFEGGEISCGMRAGDGAIEGCTIQPGTLEPALRVIGGLKPVGICGSGIIDVIAQLLRLGAINGRGDFRLDSPRICRDEHGVARYILAWSWESGTGREISIDEVDIDCFIRAKGAIYSAIDTMLDTLGMEEENIDAVYVAGGIGSGISMENAIAIGMLPELPVDRFRFIGNSALSGACAAVLGDGAWEKLREIAANMTYLELSTCPSYMDAFVAACFLPHTDKKRKKKGM